MANLIQLFRKKFALDADFKKQIVPPICPPKVQMPPGFSGQFEVSHSVQKRRTTMKNSASLVNPSKVITMILHLKVFDSPGCLDGHGYGTVLPSSYGGGHLPILSMVATAHSLHNDNLTEASSLEQNHPYEFRPVTEDNSYNIHSHHENVPNRFSFLPGAFIGNGLQIPPDVREAITAYIEDDDDFLSRVGDPIPTEYQPTRTEHLIHLTEHNREYSNLATTGSDDIFLRAETSARTSPDLDQRSASSDVIAISYDPLTQRQQNPHCLTAVRLALHNKMDTTGEMVDSTFRGPYSFMANPNHPPPDSGFLDNFDLQLDCPDACVDCEVSPKRASISKIGVDRWFEGYVTREDLQTIIWPGQVGETEHLYPFSGVEHNRCLTDDPNEIDHLFGACTYTEFGELKTLKQYTPPSHLSPAEQVTGNMLYGEHVNPFFFSYYHGQGYNSIVAEYEPKFLPAVGLSSARKLSVPIEYPGGLDTVLPIWEARGRPLPGQGEGVRMAYARREYRRQWEMFRQIDDARMRYVAAVMRDAAVEFGVGE